MWLKKINNNIAKRSIVWMMIVGLSSLILINPLYPGTCWAEEADLCLEKLEHGRQLYLENEWEEAIISLKEATNCLTDQDRLWEANFYLGFSYYLLGEQKRARAGFRDALKTIKSEKELIRDYKSNPGKLTDEEVTRIYSSYVQLPPDDFSPDVNDLYVTEREIIVDSARKKIKPFYKKWWFWTAVSTLIVGGVTAGLIINNQGNGDGGDDDTGDVTVNW
jgi:tetratricopeptide (TPR) repeat protein